MQAETLKFCKIISTNSKVIKLNIEKLCRSDKLYVLHYFGRHLKYL